MIYTHVVEDLRNASRSPLDVLEDEAQPSSEAEDPAVGCREGPRGRPQSVRPFIAARARCPTWGIFGGRNV
jgi:hypothetical protein